MKKILKTTSYTNFSKATIYKETVKQMFSCIEILQNKNKKYQMKKKLKIMT